MASIVTKNTDPSTVPTPSTGKTAFGTNLSSEVFIKDDTGAVTIITSGGTVTSVGITGNDGISVSGSPVTTSGSITLDLGNITPTSVAATGTVTGSNLSGTNTGDQTLNSLLPSQTGNNGKILGTDGTNSSWVTAPATGVTSVAASSANAAISVSGSPITSTGTLTLTANTFTSTDPGVAPASGGGTSNYLRADGTWASPGGGVTSFNTRTGAVTLSSGDVTTALGFTPGVGTVTSVGVSGGTTGLSFSGGPITGSGTITAGGVLAIANGGTGESNATDAFQGLSPMTTNGDLITQAAGVPARLGVGSDGQVLTVVSGAPAWATGGGGGSAAGSSTQIQYNTSGAFDASSKFTFDPTGVASTKALLTVGNGDDDGYLQLGDETSVSSGHINLGSSGSQISGGPALNLYSGVLSNAGGNITIESGTGSTSSGDVTLKAGSGSASTTPGSVKFVTAPAAGTSVTRLAIDGTGAWRLGAGASAGTSGQVLTSSGSGAAPTWTTVGGGSSATSIVATPVALATTTNISLSGNTAVDGFTTVAGDRVLVRAQTTASQNGIYVASAGAWSRATDFDATAEIPIGVIVPVQFGRNFGGKQLVLDFDGTNYSITVGTTAMYFYLLNQQTYKDPVLVATTANGTLATSFANGQTVDGITITTGSRILLKNQSTATDNGIYVVNASGAPSRAADFGSNTTAVSTGVGKFTGASAIIPVQFGTLNGGSTWQLMNGGTAGSTSYVFGPLNGVAAGNQLSWTTQPKAGGTNAVAIGNAAQAQSNYSVAIGDSANCTSTFGVAIGRNAVASSQSVALGNNCNAAGSTCIVIGTGGNVSAGTGSTYIGSGSPPGGISSYSTSVGYQNGQGDFVSQYATVVGNNNWSPSSTDGCVVIGSFQKGENIGEVVLGISGFASFGDAKMSMMKLLMTTTNATVTELKLGLPSGFNTTGGGNAFVMTNDSTYVFNCDIVARNTATDTESAAWNLTFAIRRGTNAASTTLIGTPTKTVIGQDTGTTTWDVSATADTTNGRPNISVTGEASKTIRWVANIRMTKVSG